MDPDANLQEQRRLTQRLMDADGLYRTQDVERLIELAAALDAWLTHGGALPKVWRR